MDLPIREATIALHGFGNVGSEAALALEERGARVVAISDATVSLHNPRGIDLRGALAHRMRWGMLQGFQGGSVISERELLTLDCSVLVPAAVERVVTRDIVPNLRCRLIAEAANGPTTNGADALLEERGDIMVIPDILCNAGGVIASYFEWLQNLQHAQWPRPRVLSELFETLERAKHDVEAQRERLGCGRRLAALSLGISRVAEAKEMLGLFP